MAKQPTQRVNPYTLFPQEITEIIFNTPMNTETPESTEQTYMATVNKLTYIDNLLALQFKELYMKTSPYLNNVVFTIQAAHEHFRLIKEQELNEPKKVHDGEGYRLKLQKFAERRTAIADAKAAIQTAKLNKRKAIDDLAKQWDDYIHHLENEHSRLKNISAEQWV